MSAASVNRKKVLIMGIGNTLLRDDGAGVHVTQTLREHHGPDPEIDIIDGGTLGLSLLPDVENAENLIVVDAGEIGGIPGEIKVFQNEEMDRQVSGSKSTVHELAISDLLDAATLTGRCPARRALVAIQPESCEWGLEPTEGVRSAIPRACALVEELASRWSS
jgi:hydrogenase maturation protease